MPSSVIRRFAYCPDSCALWVVFTSGRRYVYSDVPEEVANTFRSAFAKGVYFNTRVTNRDHVLLYVCRDVRCQVPKVADKEIAETGFFALDALPETTTQATRQRLKEIAGEDEVQQVW